MHVLCHHLNMLGERAFVVPYPLNLRNDPSWPDFAGFHDQPLVNWNLNTPLLTQEIADWHYESKVVPITIYPEVFDDPISAPFIVRYILNYPGLLAPKYKTPHDMTLSYSRRLANYVGADPVLHLPVIDMNFFYNKKSYRSGSCFYAGKYKIYGGDLSLLPSDSVEILRNEQMTREEVRDIFWSKKVFYCFEDSALAIEACLCGCAVVFRPNSHFKDGPISSYEFGNDGMAWGTDDNEVVRALNTVSRVKDRLHDLYARVPEEVSKFSRAAKSLAIGREYKARIVLPYNPKTVFVQQSRPNAMPAMGWGGHGGDATYRKWYNIFGLHESDGQVMAERMMQQWRHHPAIHLIVVLRRGEGVRLAATLDSLSTQIYTGWGLTVLAEEPCPDPQFAQIQNVEWRESGWDRAAALNAIVGESESDWVGLLRSGDRLAQQALFACADRPQGMGGVRWLYTDWDRIDEAGDRYDPRFERDVDLDWLRTGECLGGFLLIRRDALLDLGGFADRGPEEARDLALRVFERFGAGAFGHVDEVLCHRPAFSRESEKPTDTGPHRAVLSAHLRRMGESGEILDGLAPGALRVRYPVRGEPVVSMIVDTVDDLRVLERFIDTLRETTEYQNLELVVVDCGSQDEDTEEYFDALRASGVVVVSVSEGVGRAEAWNAGACAARGEYLIFADRRAGFVQKDWLEILLGHAQREGVGIVAPRIVGADGTVVHSALILGFGGPAKDAFRGLSALDPGYGGRALTEQGCSAVPPCCLMVRRACFEAIGGFDAERFSSDWFSVDFCLRSEAAGHRTIWTPYALVGWQAHELAREAGDPEQEAAAYDRWLPRLARDPFYHRNLDLSGAVFRPRMEATARWNPAFHERPRILGVPADTFGCGEYRILAPLNALDDAARAHCGLLAPQEGSPRMPSVTELARLAPDTLLLQGALDDVHLEALRRYRRFNQVFRVFDMEDLKTNVPEKNSRRPFLFRNIKARTRQALSLCDRLIVTTEPLAEAYRDLIGDIKVVPVYLARERWGTVAAARDESGRPRVGWAGGQQHEGDLEILLPIVQATAGEVDWVFLGMCPEALRPYVKEVHDMVPFAEYPARLASLALDLAVAPLEEHPFNVAKTNLRLLEYGILGLPIVCTDIEPYRGVPVMRVPNDPVRWIEAIRERVYDLDAARAEGARLREWVLGGWMLEDHLDEWMEALSPSEGTGAVVVGQPQRIADVRGS
jgi:GT2 family glycosyltransferase